MRTSSVPPEVVGLAKDRPSVLDVIESIGLGWGQWRMISITAFALLFCEQLQCNLSSIMIPAQSSELHSSPSQRASLQMVFCLGAFLGSCGCAIFADVSGRRAPILMGFGLVAVFAGAMSATPYLEGSEPSPYAYAYLIVCRLFVGFGTGVGIPAARTMMSEVTPGKDRFTMSSAAKGAMVVGSCSAKVMSYFDDPAFYDVHWRELALISAAAPLACLLIACFVVSESPVFLASVGRQDEALAGLEALKFQNGATAADTDFDPGKCIAPDGSVLGQGGRTLPMSARLGTLFSRRYWATSVTLIGLSLMNGIVSGGWVYAIPQVVDSLVLIPGAEQLIMISFFNFIAAWICWQFTHMCARKTLLRAALLIGGLSCLLFHALASHVDLHSMVYSINIEVAMIAWQMMNCFIEIIVWQMAADSFPPFAASTGTAMIFCCDRGAQFVAPMLFEALQAHTGHFQSAIKVVAWMMVTAFIVVMFAPVPLTPYDSSEDDMDEAFSTREGSSSLHYGSAAAMLAGAKA